MLLQAVLPKRKATTSSSDASVSKKSKTINEVSALMDPCPVTDTKHSNHYHVRVESTEY